MEATTEEPTTKMVTTSEKSTTEMEATTEDPSSEMVATTEESTTKMKATTEEFISETTTSLIVDANFVSSKSSNNHYNW